MYNNIGNKIKGLAKGVFIFETIIATITGIILMASDENLILVGLIILLVFPLIAWISSWLLYGFGELIEKTCEIAKNTKKTEPSTATNNIQIQKEQTKKVETPEDDNYLDYICPQCDQIISFVKGTKETECPWCNTTLQLP